MYTYVLKAGDYFKIGKSSNVDKRLYDIQVSNPFKVIKVIVIDGDYESELHGLYHGKNIRGEWYELSHSDVENIKTNYCAMYYRKPDYSYITFNSKHNREIENLKREMKKMSKTYAKNLLNKWWFRPSSDGFSYTMSVLRSNIKHMKKKQKTENAKVETIRDRKIKELTTVVNMLTYSPT